MNRRLALSPLSCIAHWACANTPAIMAEEQSRGQSAMSTDPDIPAVTDGGVNATRSQQQHLRSQQQLSPAATRPGPGPGQGLALAEQRLASALIQSYEVPYVLEVLAPHEALQKYMVSLDHTAIKSDPMNTKFMRVRLHKHMVDLLDRTISVPQFTAQLGDTMKMSIPPSLNQRLQTAMMSYYVSGPGASTRPCAAQPSCMPYFPASDDHCPPFALPLSRSLVPSSTA